MESIIPVLADWKKVLNAYWENGAVLGFMVLRVFAWGRFALEGFYENALNHLDRAIKRLKRMMRFVREWDQQGTRLDGMG